MNFTHKTLPFGNKRKIRTWKQFAKVREDCGCNLLQRLGEFDAPVLVSGVQRSGTTILARIISQSEGMINYWTGKDDELDAALILSGYADYNATGRHCFQTTYLNDCFEEYLSTAADYRLVWVSRNPYSVVQSMLYNWKSYALNDLFLRVGLSGLTENDYRLYRRFGIFGISKIKRACYAYAGKLSQIFYLEKRLNPKRLMIIDYDQLVLRRFEVLENIYRFIELPYNKEYSNKIHTNSIQKDSKLTVKDKAIIDDICMPSYSRVENITLKIDAGK